MLKRGGLAFIIGSILHCPFIVQVSSFMQEMQDDCYLNLMCTFFHIYTTIDLLVTQTLR